MPGSLQALAVLFILLPGFLAAYVLQMLVTRPKQSDLEKVVEALIFSFIIYFASAPVLRQRLPVSWHNVTEGGVTSWVIDVTYWKLLVMLVLLPLAFGLISAFLMQRDYLLRFFRHIDLTDRTSRASTWKDVLQDVEGVAQVELADGRSLMGWVRYYSDDSEDASIFLERAAWVNADSSGLEPIDGPGILLTKEAKIRCVMFLNAPDSGDE